LTQIRCGSKTLLTGRHKGTPAMSTLKVVSQTTSTPLVRLVEDFLASCRARGLSPATLKRGYVLHLERVFLPWCAQNGITSVEQLDQRTIDRFSSKLLGDGGDKGQLSRFSVHTYVRTVGQFLSWCRKEGEAATGKPQLPRLPRRLLDVLSRAELAAMEDAAPYERDKLIIRVLADTGLRAGELCGLRAEDLMRSDRRAYLKVQGKGLQERLVPLPPALVRRIDRYQRTRPADADTDRLFIGVRRTIGGGYEGLTPSGVLQLVHGAAERDPAAAAAGAERLGRRGRPRRGCPSQILQRAARGDQGGAISRRRARIGARRKRRRPPGLAQRGLG